MSQQPRLKREHELEVRELPDDEIFVYDRQRRVTHYLSSEIAFVWQNCDGRTGRDDLERMVRTELKLAEPEVTVRNALSRLEYLNLLLHPR